MLTFNLTFIVEILTFIFDMYFGNFGNPSLYLKLRIPGEENLGAGLGCVRDLSSGSWKCVGV